MEADRLNYPARKRFSLSTPMNLSTTNDIIGGNSGSPLIDKDANVVGLIFEGNIFSLGGDYGYDGAQNRAIAVDSRALLEGLRKVYHFPESLTRLKLADARSRSANLKDKFGGAQRVSRVH